MQFLVDQVVLPVLACLVLRDRLQDGDLREVILLPLKVAVLLVPPPANAVLVCVSLHGK